MGTYPGYKHVIALSKDFQPHATKVRPVPLSRRDAVMTEIQNMVSSGIWSPVEKSECAHAMVTVGKKDGGVRITSDLSPLNKYIIPDRFTCYQRIAELFLKLRGMSHFSKIDLRKGYYHIELEDESKRYTLHSNNHATGSDGIQPPAHGPIKDACVCFSEIRLQSSWTLCKYDCFCG